MRLIELLDKSSFFDRFITGPILTLLLLLVGYVLTDSYDQITPTLVFPVVVGLSFSVFIGGLRSGFISATLITGFAIWSSDFDPVRTGSIAAACYIGAYLQGLTKHWLIETTIKAQAIERAADLIEAANGNIRLLRQGHQLITDLDMSWIALKDRDRREIVSKIRGIMSDLLTLIAGWEYLAANRRSVTGETDEHGEVTGFE